MYLIAAAQGDVDTTVQRCQELGVDAVYLSVAAFPGYRENGFPELGPIQDFKGALEDRGIRVPSATYWFAKWPDRPFRSGATNPDVLLSGDLDAVGAMAKIIETLGEAGIQSVLHYVDLGKPLEEDQLEGCWEGLEAIYRELIPIAESYGIGIGNHSLHRLLADGVRERAVADGVSLADYGTYATDGWGGPFLLGTWRELERLIDSVPSDSNGVTLCTGMDLNGGGIVDLVQRFSGRIHFCQLRDHTDRWPAGYELLPGKGRVDLEGVIRALSEVGYAGPASPEHLGGAEFDGQDLQKEAFEFYSRFIPK